MEPQLYIKITNNYSPLSFHKIKSFNVKLSKSKKSAYSSILDIHNGIVFSDRPVKICEPVFVKVLEMSSNLTGSLSIGFTTNDPESMKSLCYACVYPDFRSVPGVWANTVGENFVEKDSVLFYYVDAVGDVHYGVGAQEYGISFGGVNTHGRLWAVLDIGNTLALQFMDPRQLSMECPNDYQYFFTNFQAENSQIIRKIQCLSFHNVGKNITLKRNGSVVSKRTFLSPAYAFIKNPVEISRTIIMIVQSTDNYCLNNFFYGITSCDPRRLDPHVLPEYIEDLLDRSEYWILKEKESSHPLTVGGTITFSVFNQGQVEVTINGISEPVFCVDHTRPLWFFVSLSHSVSELKLAGLFGNLHNAVENASEFSFMKTTDCKNSGTMVNSGTGQQSSSDCAICYEEPVDCAFYKCGHMCTCFSCASKLRSSGSTSRCPICRKTIQDVLKIYK